MSDAPPKRSRQRKIRKQALDLLYAVDLCNQPLERVAATYPELNQHPTTPEALRLARGVEDHLDDLDDALAAATSEGGWTVDRMPVADRALARLASFEMLYDALPPAVAITETRALAGELSTDESPAFLTGVLTAVAKTADLFEEEPA